MVILGIDTALRTTGYGVISVDGKRISALDCGVIKTKQKEPHSECLRRLAGGVDELITAFAPDQASIEGGFFQKNAKTAMVLGMARGVAVAALAKRTIPVYEYAPRKARKMVMGHGGTGKAEVAAYMAQLLSLDVADIPDDATDALAIAICHALSLQTHGGIYLGKPV